MTFINTPINDANPGAILYSQLETAMFAQGWVLADSVTIGGNTHRVMKSAAAGNAYNLDWYLDIIYPTTGVTGGFKLVPMEGYNFATKKAIRGTVYIGTTVEQTYFSRWGATEYSLEDANWVIGANPTYLAIALVANITFTPYFSVNRNRIYGFLTNAPTNILYTGFWTPSIDHTAYAAEYLFPLIQAKMLPTGYTTGVSGTTSVTLTRAPKAKNDGTFNWQFSVNLSVIMALTSGQIGGTSNFTGKFTLSPVLVYMGGDNVNVLYGNGGGSFVGTLDGVAVGIPLPSTIRGDSILIGADTWYSTSLSGNQSMWLQAI